MLGIVTENATEIVTGIATESTIEIGEGTGHVKGGAVVAVTVAIAKNEVAAGRGEIMTGENETTKVMRY